MKRKKSMIYKKTGSRKSDEVDEKGGGSYKENKYKLGNATIKGIKTKGK